MGAINEIFDQCKIGKCSIMLKEIIFEGITYTDLLCYGLSFLWYFSSVESTVWISPIFIHFRANPAHLLHLFPAMNKNMFHELLDVEPWHSSFGSSLVDSRNRKSRANKNRSRKWKNFKYLKASKKNQFRLKINF